jgi:14-3-3 protein epsilon
MNPERDDCVFLVKLCEEAERFDDMVIFMNKIANTEGIHLTLEERVLLATAFRNVLFTRRYAWRTLSHKPDNDESTNHAAIRREYISKIEKEIVGITSQVVQIVDVLVKNAETKESSLFYHKMKANHYKFLADVSSGAPRESAANEALSAYNKATEDSLDLPTTHPLRLQLALDFSDFYWEILGDNDKYWSIANEAFDNALADIDSLPEDSYKHVTLLMQLLRDSRMLWSPGDAED